MRVVYNDADPYICAWLRNLIEAGCIRTGHVEESDIAEIRPAEVRDAQQFHAFAGIGGWSYALQLAGWPEEQPAWTGSCPCQPFSIAGRWRGLEDARHLWPDWYYPGTFPLAHGATARVGQLRAYSNAIVPQVAATFIRAVMESYL